MYLNVKSNSIQCYAQLLQISGNEFNPTQFKTKLREWLQKYPEKCELIEKRLDTCTVKGMWASTCYSPSRYLSLFGNWLLMVGHITVVELKLKHVDVTNDFGQFLKRTLPQNSRSSVTYVIPVTVNCRCCATDDGRGDCPKHVEWSCNKTKTLLLYLVGYLYTYVEKDVRNHEPKTWVPNRVVGFITPCCVK
jgi:hypothetical protein